MTFRTENITERNVAAADEFPRADVRFWNAQRILIPLQGYNSSKLCKVATLAKEGLRKGQLASNTSH